MDAHIVHIVHCSTWEEDYCCTYEYILGVYSSRERAYNAICKAVEDLDDKIEDSNYEINKNNRSCYTYKTREARIYTINEFAVDMEWNRPINKT